MANSNARSLIRTLALLSTPLLLALWPTMSHEIQTPTLDLSKVPPPNSYAGSDACAACHHKQAHSYATTPHARDSSLPSPGTIIGDFTPECVVLRSSNPNLAYVMAAGPDGFYEAAVNPSDPQSMKPD